MSRYARNVDQNHGSIVEALEAVGASVESLAAVGKGVPDLLVAYRGVNYLFEVKNPNQKPSKQRLRASQVTWHERWRGPVLVVRTAEEALVAIGAVKPPRKVPACGDDCADPSCRAHWRAG